ncbi:LacI family DNA-binding transcriptional regulator [Tessaracoccus defluvii]|uniref:LacI family DNA-binding transcriptional regulator n=1 Tax=Tessaracoccus defluvii TaxID=1285901 RepID=A0A7H0H5G2_9ACTN|nr:LacI family DNA-binding transcriptional regulator [Tessaracoccus defluvii]QNP55778.1 LacI family DNA-binding transcriptional regulator [Tessaracoccus defluvii]
MDVAKLAGVSMRTVSNVVNDYPHVADATRERVERAISELGYRPNLVARNLASGRTGLVALVVPRLEMPYFASLAQQMLEVAEAEGVVLVVQQTHDSHALELKALEGRFGQPIDGIVLSSTTLTDEDIARRRSRLPLVLLGDRVWPESVSAVAIDQVEAAKAAVAHLFSLGRRRVAVVGPGVSGGSNARWRGWVQAHEEAGVTVDPALQVESEGISGEHGVAAGVHIATAHPRPDAVFCFTDWLALGVIRGLQRAGLSVPEDVAVVGFDDIPYGRASNPTLTTISPDRGQIAAVALRSVLDQGRVTTPPARHEASWRLVVRESSG